MSSYGYNFQDASQTSVPTSTISIPQGKPAQTASAEERTDSAVSFLSSEPGHEVENTASSASKSQIPGIETVPVPSKSSAPVTRQPTATTEVLTIGGGPPVMSVTIIEPDADGNLETSVLTLSEESPWQTPAPRVRDIKDGNLRARVDGNRMGLALGLPTRDPSAPATTMPPVRTGNNTSISPDAASNATETLADVRGMHTPSSVPLDSSSSVVKYYLDRIVFVFMAWVIGRWISS
ncbi:hypothetical protein HC256_009770 [Beauveria bassiana]|nr:hypothetical protein HC256_009770 [Beauveria bassiana]